METKAIIFWEQGDFDKVNPKQNSYLFYFFFHDSICIHFARHFLQPTYHTYIYFCYLHTCILFCKGFLLTINIFERHFPTYSHFFFKKKHIYMHLLLYVHISLTHIYTHLRGNFMLYIHAYTHSFEEQFSCYPLTLWKDNFMSYIHILRSTFVLHSTYIHILLPIQYMYALFEWYFLLLPILYIYVYIVKNIFTPSKRIIFNMMQPKPSASQRGTLQTCSHFYAFFTFKTQKARPMLYSWHLF